MKLLLRLLASLPWLTFLGYAFYLAYTGQWLYFFILCLAVALFTYIVFSNNPWE